MLIYQQLYLHLSRYLNIIDFTGRIESDSEYDSEMDDFIDDGPQEGVEDVSSVIKEIFGYDKSRWAISKYEFIIAVCTLPNVSYCK